MGGLRYPSLLASLALHLAVLLAALIAWPMITRPLKMSETVPVTIVSKAPDDMPAPALKAPAPAPRSAPEPDTSPEPPPPPPPAVEEAPQPTPRPAPARPAPAKPVAPPRPAPPAPSPKPQPPPPQQKSPEPAKPRTTPDLNLDQLSKSPTKQKTPGLDLSSLATAPTKTQRSQAAKGPSRAAEDLVAQLASGRSLALSPDALAALRAKLIPLWHPDCDSPGAASIVIRVEMKVAPDGRLLSDPVVLSKSGSAAAGPDLLDIAARHALAAVRHGEPYTELPKEADHDIAFRFDARQACQG